MRYVLLITADTTRRNPSKVNRTQLELISHLVYSTDLSQSVCRLSDSLQNHLNGKAFGSDQAVEGETLLQSEAFWNVEFLNLLKDGISLILLSV